MRMIAHEIQGRIVMTHLLLIESPGKLKIRMLWCGIWALCEPLKAP